MYKQNQELVRNLGPRYYQVVYPIQIRHKGISGVSTRELDSGGYGPGGQQRVISVIISGLDIMTLLYECYCIGRQALPSDLAADQGVPAQVSPRPGAQHVSRLNVLLRATWTVYESDPRRGMSSCLQPRARLSSGWHGRNV